MRNLTRRDVLIGAGGISIAAALAACSSPGSSGGSGSGSGSGSNSKTITLMNWEAEKGSPYPAVLAAFEKATGYKIEYQFSASGSDYWPKTRTVLGSNNPPDLMRIDDDFVAYYASTGKLADLRKNIKASKLSESDYYPAVFNNTKQPDGSIVGWSLGIQPRVIYYNKTMFQKAGIPLPPSTWTDEDWTWDDFLAAAKKLTIPDKQWGACISDDSGFEMIFPVNNGGTGRWSHDGKTFTLANPADAAGYQWVADLTCKSHVQPTWSVLQQSGKGQELFAAGQIGMIQRVSGLTSFFQENVKDFEWDIAPIPGNKSQKTYGNQLIFAIPEKAANPEGAWKLLEFMTSMDGAKIFAQQGSFVPGLKAAADLIKATPGKSPANMSLVLDAVDNSVLPGRVVNDQAAVSLYRPALDPILNCQQPASKVLPKVKSQVESIIS